MNKRRTRLVAVIMVFAASILMFPVSPLALDGEATLSESFSDRIPPLSDISGDLEFAEASASGDIGILSAISGSSSIAKTSSSSVRIAGYSSTPISDPALNVTLRLQVYYNGAWQTLATVSKTTSGTRVDLTQSYTVTSGYYYRTRGTHSLSSGQSATSTSGSVYVG